MKETTMKMKPYQAREAGMPETYFKLDKFDPRICAFRPTKGWYATEDKAREAAAKGRFRIVTCHGRDVTEGLPFEA